MTEIHVVSVISTVPAKSKDGKGHEADTEARRLAHADVKGVCSR